VSTDLTEQISRRFPGDSRRDFKQNPGHVCIVRPAMQCTESTSLPKYRTKTWYARHGAVAKTKRATSFLNKRSGTQFHHDWKPMQSIIDILHKNFKEDHTNSKRFPGFPRGFLNSRRFPGFADTLSSLTHQKQYGLFMIRSYAALFICAKWRGKWSLLTNFNPTFDQIQLVRY